MKRIYTGWYSDQLRQEWTERCRQDLLSGRRNFRFLLPTRHLIRQVREALTATGLGVSEQIGTFDDIVDLGLSKETRILRLDEQGKLAVLSQALEQCGEEALAVFRPIVDMPGFLRSLLEAIEEIKSSGFSAEDVASWFSEQTGASGAAQASGMSVAQAFASVYRHYQELLQSHPAGRLLDRQEGYRVAANHLFQYGEELFQGIEAVYVDFLTVTPLQFPLVEAICRHVPHVEIFMPYPKRAGGMRVLQHNGNRLIAALRKIGVEHADLSQISGLSPVSAGIFSRLARTVFEEDEPRLPASLPLELIPSASPLQEVRAVAKEIKRLTKEGYRPEEIAIVTEDDATYRPLLHRVFRDNRIAVCLSDIQNLIETPLVQDLIKRMERIVQEKKAGHSGGAADFPEKSGYAEYAQAVRDWAAREQLAEQLYQRAAQAGAYSLQDLRRDVQAWQTCLDSLDSLTRAKRLYGDRQVRFTRFWSEWKELIRQGKVQVDAGAGVGVQVFRPSEMRGLSYHVVFVLGLNEGRYPKQLGEHWLIERLERAASDKGAVFQRKEQVELHRLLFRYVIQSAAERLYLGYQSPQADERNLPSSYLEAVIRAVEPGDWREPMRFQSAMSLLPIPDDWQEISSPQEWRERTALWLGGEATLHVGREPDLSSLARFERELARGDWPRLFERLAIDAERNGGEPSPFAGRLQNPAIRTILAQQYGPQFAWSVSMINEYAVCPFKFFAGKVLRIEAKEAPEDGISVQDRGIFLHDLNQRLLLPLTEAEQVGEQEARSVLDRYDLVFEDTCRDWEDTELTRSLYWPAEKERLRKEMRIWLERELEHLLQSRMRPRHLEWSFGNRMQGEDRQPADIASTEQLISLQVGDEPMEFRGRIDRIDVTEDGTGFAIYDYKTSLTRYKGLQDLQDGTNWQLPVYLTAFARWKKQQGEQLEPLGGGFLRMSPAAEKKRGIWAQAASDWGIRDTRKTDLSEDLSAELTEALAQIAQQRAEVRDGVFDAKPRVECDPHCQYATVCRFDPAKKGRTT